MFKNFTIFLLFTSLYSFSYVFFKSPVEFYLSYLIFMMYFPVFFVKFGIPKWPVLIFLPLLISGVLYCQIGLNTYDQFLKIFIGFFTSCLFYHYMIQAFDYDLKTLFRYYIKSAYVVSIIGLAQVISYQVGFYNGYHLFGILNKWNVIQGGFGIRMNSVFSEPAYYAAVIAPAFFVAIYNVFTRYPIYITRQQSYLIALVYPLTFSSLGILAILLTTVLLLLNMGFVKYSLVFIPLLIVIGTYSYRNVPEFSERWDGTIEIFSSNNIYDYDIHGSSFVLYNNSHVAWENFIRNPIMGTGLGSHPIAFDKYSLTNIQGAVQIDFNKMDANSMFLRLMSETGLYGILLMAMLLLRCWVFKRSTSDREVWVMSNGLALIIIIYLVRQGHYFLNGFPFFLWMFYYLSVLNKKNMIAEKNSQDNASMSGESQEPPMTMPV